MSTTSTTLYCTSTRRQAEQEDVDGTTRRCPNCGLEYDPRPPEGARAGK